MSDNTKTGLVVNNTIQKDKLNKYDYTNSLIREGMNAKLMLMDEVGRIQNQIMVALADMIIQKTNGESTSLPIDETKSLMQSIMYTLDRYLESFLNPDEALEQLKTKEISELLKKGTNIVAELYRDSKEKYIYISKKKLKIQLDCYHTTIDEGIPFFLKNYNIVFGAHLIPTTIDYPLAIDDWNVMGVKFIHNYLSTIILESHFCKIFGEDKIEKLLSLFGKKIGMDYKLELLNLFELAYNNAIFMIFDNKEAINLIPDKESSLNIIHKVMGTKEADLEQRIKKVNDILMEQLSITDEKMIKYFTDYCPNFLSRIKNAVKHDSLDSMVIYATKEKVVEHFSIFQSQKAMNDKAFTKMADRMNQIYDSKVKAEYVVKNITSLTDFMDILNSNYLYGDEYGALFQKISVYELAILFKIIFYEELRDRKSTYIPEIFDADVMLDYEWKEAFVDYIRNVEKNKLDQIDELLNQINYEQIKFN